MKKTTLKHLSGFKLKGIESRREAANFFVFQKFVWRVNNIPPPTKNKSLGIA